MTTNFNLFKGSKKTKMIFLAILLISVICYLPFKLTIADKREFRVVDVNGNSVNSAMARQTWYQYSLDYRREQTHKADEGGYVFIPQRAIKTNLIDLTIGAISKIMEYKIHAGIGSSDSIGVYAEGYNWKWFYDGEGLGKTVVLNRKK